MPLLPEPGKDKPPATPPAIATPAAPIQPEAEANTLAGVASLVEANPIPVNEELPEGAVDTTLHTPVMQSYWKPLQDKILVEPIDPETVTKSGIIIPYIAQEKQAQGVVVATGPGIWHHGVFLDMEIKPGQTVLYSKHAGHEFKLHDKQFIIIRESDVLLAKFTYEEKASLEAEPTATNEDPPTDP